MSKRKSTDELQDSVDKIRELLPRIKHGIASVLQTVSSSESTTLLEQLARLAAHAEIVHELRERAGAAWTGVADELDREGTAVWNMSVGMKELSGAPSRIYAAVRLAGFRLVQAGLELSPKEDTLVHILRLACKVSAALTDAGDHALASRTLTSAATYEEALRTIPTATDADEQRTLARAQVTTLYFRARMVAAWKDGNNGVAQFMLQKITDADTEILAVLSPRDLEELVRDIMNIGKALLRPPRASQGSQTKTLERHAVDSLQAQEAVTYLQRAYALAEKADVRPTDETIGTSARDALRELKRCTLRTLARAYYFSHSLDAENLARAEATLEELLRDPSRPPYSHLTGEAIAEDDNNMRYMLFVVRKRRGAPAGQIEEALKDIIDHSPCSEASMKTILVEIRSEPSNPSFFFNTSQHLLARVLKLGREQANATVGQVLLAIIFQATRDPDLRRGMGQLTTAFDAVFNSGFTLEKTPCAACLTLLWQAGDRQYAAKHHGPAASLFELGTHKIFEPLGPPTVAKCCRKAAICHIGAQEFARAAQIVRKGDEDGHDAGTWYVLFLVAVEQGVEDEAARAAERMVRAADFDARMLRLALQMASERGMRALLWATLDLLLRAVRGALGGRLAKLDYGVEAITLVRCLVRLGREELNAPGVDAEAIFDALLDHLATAKTIVEEAFSAKREAALTKDLSWLWRTAFNLAVDSCAAWGGSTGRTSRLFALATEMLEMYVRAVIVDAEPEAWMHLVVARFAATSGRAFTLREELAAGSADEAPVRALLAELAACKARIGDVLTQGRLPLAKDGERASAFMRYLRVFEIEFLCALGEWATLADVVQEAVRVDAKAHESFESIANIVWTREDCPMNVLSPVLETLLHTSLDVGKMSMSTFSRWLRLLVDILLKRGNDAERIKAVGYVEQAAGVMADQAGDDGFPADERQWLMATTYNTGLDCLQAGLTEEARRWVECSMTIARLLPGSEAAVEKISVTYRGILARAERATC